MTLVVGACLKSFEDILDLPVNGEQVCSQGSDGQATIQGEYRLLNQHAFICSTAMSPCAGDFHSW
jgi:hypothetical protein